MAEDPPPGRPAAAVHIDPHLIGIVFHAVTGVKVFYVADNSAENITRLCANPLTTPITDFG